MATQAELRAIAKLDGKPFEGEIGKLGNKVASFGSAQLAPLKGMIAGAFSVGAIVAFGKSVLETMTKIKDLSIQAGISTDEFQGLSFVVRRAGADEEQLARAMARVDKAQQDALAGNKQMIAAFNALGVSRDNLIKLNPAEIFTAMSKALTAAHMTGEPLLATMDIIGMKVAPALKQAMKSLAEEGLQAVIDKSKEAGESFDKDIILKAKEVGDAIEGLKRKTKVASIETGYSVVKLIAEFKEYFKYLKTLSAKDWANFYIDPKEAKRKWEQYKTVISPEAIAGLGLGKYAGMAGAEVGPRMPGILTPEQRERDLLARKTAAKEAEEERKKQEEGFKKEEAHREKLIKLMEEQDKLALDYAERQKDILAGRGIERPREARVGALQAIGLIVGGVAGGDVAARRAERTEKVQEAQRKLIEETNRKLDEISDRIYELGVE